MFQVQKSLWQNEIARPPSHSANPNTFNKFDPRSYIFGTLEHWNNINININIYNKNNDLPRFYIVPSTWNFLEQSSTSWNIT